MQEMFGNVDGDVIRMTLEDCDYELDAATECLADMITSVEEHAAQKREQKQHEGRPEKVDEPTDSDESLARRLAEEMEHEERARRAAQEKVDSDIARSLMAKDSDDSNDSERTRTTERNATVASSAAAHNKCAQVRAQTNRSADVRGESGKWNVKQPPQNAASATVVSNSGQCEPDRTLQKDHEPAEVKLSKKARRRRNRNQRLLLNAPHSKGSSEPVSSKQGKADQKEERSSSVVPSASEVEAALAFIRNIFPSFEESLLRILYEEQEYELERTIEALLTLTHVDESKEASSASTTTHPIEERNTGEISPDSSSPATHSPSLSSDEDDFDLVDDWEHIHEEITRMIADGQSTNSLVAGDENEETLPSVEQSCCDSVANETGHSIPDEKSTIASAFTSNLDKLADLFPEYDRQALAVALEANNDDVELTAEELLAQAFVVSLRRSGDKPPKTWNKPSQRKLTVPSLNPVEVRYTDIRWDERSGVSGKMKSLPRWESPAKFRLHHLSLLMFLQNQ